MEDEAILVLCTAPSEDVGAKLARGLVEGKLAACVNVIPGLRSFYVWKGELNDDAEVQLFIKTRVSRAKEVESYLAEHHPYDTPEVLFLTIRGGSDKYLDWLREQTNR
jgi:periplasmic divalent cation tolerance protein